MKATNVTLLTGMNEQEKERAKAFGAIWIVSMKGWVLSAEAYERFLSDEEPEVAKPDEPITSVGSDKKIIYIADLNSEWKIYGPGTFAKKEAIKTLGGTFSPSDKSWRLKKVTNKRDLTSVQTVKSALQ